MSGKFEPGKIYEVVYTAQNPPIVGLGPAAIRDVISMLKYQSADAWSIPATAINRALAFGISVADAEPGAPFGGGDGSARLHGGLLCHTRHVRSFDPKTSARHGGA